MDDVLMSVEGASEVLNRSQRACGARCKPAAATHGALS